MKHPSPVPLWSILLIGITLRLAGANHPLWLDEIWSCDIAMKLSSPFGVLHEPPALVDNNHPLNTFWLAILGNRQPYWLYHVPSLLAGIGTLIGVGVCARRHSRAAALWALSLAAVSLPLIQFSDEARGYAPAAFFGLLMFDAFERFVARQRLADAALFFAACVVGGLSHVLILHVYLGLAAVSVWTLWRQRQSIRPLRSIAVLHTGPLLFWLAYYALFVSRLQFGGGAPRSFLFQSVCGSLAGLCGWIGPLSWLPALILVVALIALAIDLARRGNAMWIFLLTACFLSPILLVAPQWILSASPVPMASRYFLPLVPIVLVLIGETLARRRSLQLVAVGVVLLNLVNSLRMIVVGPGDGAEVIQTLRHDHAPIRVLADHPLRTKSVLEFYAARLPNDQRVSVYDLTEHLSTEAADSRWLIVHGRGEAAPRGIDIGSGRPFRFVRQIPAFGLSGYDFSIYGRSD